MQGEEVRREGEVRVIGQEARRESKQNMGLAEHNKEWKEQTKRQRQREKDRGRQKGIQS
jgi:hypothetical protein